MRNVALLDGKLLTALLALGLIVSDPLNEDGSIRMLNLISTHHIEMLIATEKPYIAGEHGVTDYTPFLAARVVVTPSLINQKQLIVGNPNGPNPARQHKHLRTRRQRGFWAALPRPATLAKHALPALEVDQDAPISSSISHQRLARQRWR